MSTRSMLLAVAAVTLASGCVELADEPDGFEDEPALGAATGALTGAMPRQPVLGLQQVLVLVTRVTAEAPPYSTSDAELMADATIQLREFADFMDATSYGQVSFAFDTRGPLVLPTSICDPDNNAHDANQRAVRAAAIHAVDDTVDFTGVRQVVLLVQQDAPLCTLRSSGANRRVWDILTGEGALDASVTFTASFYRDSPATLTHEYAHTIGGAHLQPNTCFDGEARVPIVHAGPGCAPSAPYIFSLDPLSLVAMHHFAMPRKLFWGWIDEPEIITPTVTSTFIMRSVESKAATAIRVPLPDSEAYGAYVLEYRDGTGLDDGQAPGLYIYADRQIPNTSYPDLIDPPPYADPDVHSGRPLQISGRGVGERYDDPAFPIAFTLQQTSGSSALVRVDLGKGCQPGARHGCCYSLDASCDGRMTCGADQTWGACQRCTSPFFCGLP